MEYTLFILLWFYILEGIPYGLQARFMPLILRMSGLSLTSLGFYKLLHIPWLFKGFYASWVDRHSAKRSWLLLSLIGLLSVTAVLSLCWDMDSATGAKHGQVNPPNLLLLSVCLFLYNAFAATQDIAVDGLTLSILRSDQLSAGNTAQVVGYKLGTLVGGGVLTTLSTFISIGRLFNLISVFYLSGIVICIYSHSLDSPTDLHDPGHPTFSPNCRDLSSTKEENVHESESEVRPASNYECLKQLTSIMTKSLGSRSLLLFLVTYKLGEGAINMLPLFLIDQGFTLSKVGLWTGILGQLSSIIGSSASYQLLNHSRTPVGVLFYLLIIRVALQIPLAVFSVQRIAEAEPNLTFASTVLTMNLILFVTGAITTVTFTLMMHCTKLESPPHLQATHYTILSTAELVGKLLFGSLAAPFTDLVGYSAANLVFLLASVAPVHLVCHRYRALCQFSAA